jgi:hypothetical protein
MLRRWLCSVALSGLFLSAVISIPAAVPLLSQEAGQRQSVTGTVTSIGNDAKSFSMDVDQAGDTKTLQFVVNESTQIQGQVGVGTSVTVEYRPNGDGQNTALSVAPQGSQP